MMLSIILLTGLSWAGSRCNDGWYSSSEGPGTCSWHGGVDEVGTTSITEISPNVYSVRPHEVESYRSPSTLTAARESMARNFGPSNQTDQAFEYLRLLSERIGSHNIRAFIASLERKNTCFLLLPFDDRIIFKIEDGRVISLNRDIPNTVDDPITVKIYEGHLLQSRLKAVKGEVCTD